MRVTGGEARGRRLASPRGAGTRPTSDRVRESLFNILGPLDGSCVLDLFCGAGTLGLEALSRGAACAWFVDRSHVPLRALEASVDALGYRSRVRMVRLHLPRGLDVLVARGQSFDLVVLDPPYGSPDLEPCLDRLGTGGLVSREGVVVVEHDRDHELAEGYGGLARFDRRRYGRTVLTFYRREA